MMRKRLFSTPIIKTIRKIFVPILTVLMVSVNGMALFHTYRMTHFEPVTIRTRNPERLSFLDKAAVLLTGVRIPKPENTRLPSDLGLKYSVRSIHLKPVITLNSWYIKGVDRDAVVILFHGYAASAQSNLERALIFKHLGYNTLLVDFRGSGNSSERTTSMGFFEADDVKAAVDYARNQLRYRNIILFGRSMGAAAILKFSSRHSFQPMAIIIECPFDSLLSTTKNRFYAMKIPAFPLAHLLVFWGGVLNGFNGFRYNPSDYADNIKARTLILHGERDSRVTGSEVTNIYNHLRGEKKLHFFQGSGHNINIYRFRREWKSVVKDFLGQRSVR